MRRELRWPVACSLPSLPQAFDVLQFAGAGEMEAEDAVDAFSGDVGAEGGCGQEDYAAIGGGGAHLGHASVVAQVFFGGDVQVDDDFLLARRSWLRGETHGGLVGHSGRFL